MIRKIIIALCLALAAAMPAASFDMDAWQRYSDAGGAALHQFDWAGAETAYRKALALDPQGDELIGTLRFLALALHMQRRASEAQSVAERALDLAEKRVPRDPDQIYDLMQAYRSILTYSGDTKAYDALGAKLGEIEAARALAAFEVNEEAKTLTHRLSGVVLHGGYGPFTISNLMVAKQDGTDVTIMYLANEGEQPETELSINVTKLDTIVGVHMDVALAAIRMKYPDAREEVRDLLDVPSKQGPMELERHVFLVSDPSGTPVRTSILIGRRGDFHVKFRLTYPVPAAPRIEPAFDAILKDFIWPKPS